MNPMIAWLCGQTGSLVAHQAVLALSITLAAFLVYRLCLRFVASGPALCAALLFALYPVDASKPIIMHTTNYFLVLVITLGALSAYLSRWRPISYLLAVLVLLTYEPYFLLFALFPFVAFLVEHRRPDWQLLRHWAILAVVLISVLLIRRHMGEKRSGELLAHLPDYLHKALSAPFIGTWTALKMMVERPWEALRHGSGPVWLVTGLAWATLHWLHNAFRGTPALPQEEPHQRLDGRSLGLFASLGGAFVLVPYLYRWHSDYYPPIVTLGRLSALHLPSAIGASMVLAAGAEACRRHMQGIAGVLQAGLSFYFALLVGVGFHIQRVEYVQNWEQQREFWRQLIALAPDAGENTVIVLDIAPPTDTPVDPRPYTRGFPVFWLATYPYNFLETINEYPSLWKKPPRVHAVWDGMVAEQQSDGVLIQSPSWRSRSSWPVLRDGNFIWLEWRGSQLVRRTDSVLIAGYRLIPQGIGPPLPPPMHRPAYRLIFPERDAEWPSIRDGKNYPR
jgi:hypothetical protein